MSETAIQESIDQALEEAKNQQEFGMAIGLAICMLSLWSPYIWEMIKYELWRRKNKKR